ncbi:MAG: putative beta-lysine N-acetyltransferase [Bradymonadaceae bacterium]|nr:putative beta-lysine N-acetyltransferase [Lujinxingiaceae bacterium]
MSNPISPKEVALHQDLTPIDDAIGADEVIGEAMQYGELWCTQPSKKKRMGLAQLTLDKGVKTQVIGHLYGLDFHIEAEGYKVRVFFDHYNDRLKILDYEASDYRAMVERVNWLAAENDFEKIFWKAAEKDWRKFLTFGYQLEGILKYYFEGKDAYVMSKFRTTERVQSDDLIAECELIEQLMGRSRVYTPPALPAGYRICMASSKHIPQLVALYRRIFQTYPSPLTHPDYIFQTMERDVLYQVVLNEAGDVVSAASAELDEKNRNAELTDCATAESERGQGLMFHILQSLEAELARRNFVAAYTLARATSFGMNLVFYRLGHEFCGRLINNCDIYGQFEDMNIWVKHLHQPLPPG